MRGDVLGSEHGMQLSTWRCSPPWLLFCFLQRLTLSCRGTGSQTWHACCMQLSTLGCSPLGSCSDVCGPLHKDTENLRKPDLARLLRAAAHALPQVLVSGALGEQQLRLTSVSQAAPLFTVAHHTASSRCSSAHGCLIICRLRRLGGPGWLWRLLLRSALNPCDCWGHRPSTRRLWQCHRGGPLCHR